MSITRKEIITKQYEVLKEQIKLYIDIDIFPSLNDYDISDLILFINIYFPKDSDYNKTIKKLMDDKNIVIDNNSYWIVSSLIINFIEKINNI